MVNRYYQEMFFRQCWRGKRGEDVQTRSEAIGVCGFGNRRRLAKESVRRKDSLAVDVLPLGARSHREHMDERRIDRRHSKRKRWRRSKGSAEVRQGT